VRRDNLVAKFWLVPVSLEAAGGFRRVEPTVIAGVVEEHRDFLLEQWHAFFGR
jgi:hypothetical protein